MYLMAVFWLMLAYYSLNRKIVWLYFLAIILAFNTFYGSVFFVVGLMVYLSYQKNWQYLLWTVVSLLTAILIVSPLLMQQWQNSRQVTALVINWKSVLGTASLKNLLLIPLKFAIGRISFEPKMAYYLLSGIWAVMVWSCLKWRDSRAILLVVPIALGLIFSWFTPLLSYFRFLYLIPILSLLIAATKTSWVKIIILAGFIIFSLVYLLNPHFWREDWQSLAHDLPFKTPVYGITSSLVALSYYRPDLLIKELRTATPVSQRLLIVPYTVEIYGFDYQTYLTSFGYQRQHQRTYRQLVLETWSR